MVTKIHNLDKVGHSVKKLTSDFIPYGQALEFEVKNSAL